SSDSPSSGSMNDPAAPPRADGNNAVYTSSAIEAHFHTFSIDMSDFSSPPAAGVSGSTSVNAAHSHTVVVPAAMLTSVATGGSVQVTTSVEGDHSHVLTLVKLGPAGTGDGGGAGGGSGGGGEAGGGGAAGGGGYGYGGGY